MSSSLPERLQAIVGAAHASPTPTSSTAAASTTPGGTAARPAHWSPRLGRRVAAVLRECRDAGVSVTVQGGRTSLVAGTVPEHDDVLLSTERLTEIGDVDVVERRIRVGAGVTAAAVQRAAADAGLLFGVDLAARDSATVGGMASTNAGGLRTVRYGNMGEQVIGLDIALPDGSLVHRHSQVRADNTGYDLASLFVGAEGTLGVITGVDLRLHPVPAYRVTAVAGFGDLTSLVATGRALRDTESIAALELIDGRSAALAAEHLDVAVPTAGDWLLLIELAGETDLTERLADALEGAVVCGEPAVGMDTGAQQRLWQVRESTAEVVGLFGPPLKFDVSLPLSAIPSFAADSAALVAEHAPEAIPVLFGHVGEGNLHLNVLRCGTDQESHLYAAMMKLIAAHDGNVSSEHGVGSRKRAYLGMARSDADIAAMRTIKDAFDPTGYLNPAVLFD